MKNSSVFLASLATALFFAQSASAADLALVVLKKGEIAQSSFTEVSRNVVYTGSSDEGKTTTFWKQGAGGMVCMKTANADRYFYGTSCTATLKVVSKLTINDFYLPVKNEAAAERSTAAGSDLLTWAEITELKATNFAGEHSPYLDLVYDVQNGTEFRDGHRKYVKNLRLYVNTETKEIMKLDTSLQYLPRPWEHNGGRPAGGNHEPLD